MTNKTLKTMLLLLFITGLSLPMLAQPPEGMGGSMAGPQGGPMMGARGAANMGAMDLPDQLGLSEQQEQQMQELRFKLERKMIELRAQLQSTQLDLRQLRTAATPNKKKIYAQIEKAGTVKIKMEKARADQMLAIQDILTADQLKIFRKHRQHRRENAGPGPGGMSQGPHRCPHSARF